MEQHLIQVAPLGEARYKHIVDAYAIAEQNEGISLLKRQLETELAGITAKERNLVDLAADGTLPRDTIRDRMNELRDQSDRITRRLNAVHNDLSASVAYIDAALALLENPGSIYERADNEQRRALNQALFEQILIDDNEVTGVVWNEPFAELAVSERVFRRTEGLDESQRLERALQLAREEVAVDPRNKKATLLGGSLMERIETLVSGIFHVGGSSSNHMVGVLRNYCNSNLATRQVNELVESARSSTPTDRSGRRVPGKANAKLALEQVNELITLYEQGDSLLQLSRRFGIHRGTVKDHLRRAGVPIRPGNQAKLSETDKGEVVRLYESGLSIHKIAPQFGVTDNPVHHALRERGVKMRSPNEKSPTPADE